MHESVMKLVAFYLHMKFGLDGCRPTGCARGSRASRRLQGLILIG